MPGACRKAVHLSATLPIFVASELARAGLLSGPKNLIKIADFCESSALVRQPGQAGASSLATGYSLTQDSLKRAALRRLPDFHCDPSR